MILNGNVFYAKHQFVLFVVRVMWKNLMNDNMAFAPKRKLKRMTMKIRKEKMKFLSETHVSLVVLVVIVV